MKKTKIKFQVIFLLFVGLFLNNCARQEITEELLKKIAQSPEYKNLTKLNNEVASTHISIDFKSRGLVNGVQQKGNSTIEFLDKSKVNEEELSRKEAEAVEILVKAFPELQLSTTSDFSKIRTFYRQFNNSNPIDEVLKIKGINNK